MATEKKFLNVPFEIKEDDIEETGIFKGYGSVFGNKDSHSDVVMPGAFTKTILKGGRNGTGVAMLLQHDTRKPIGVWNMLAEDKKGLRVEGQLAMKTKDGQETHELMKLGALRGLSIGYDTIIDEIDNKKNLRYLKEVDLWEISPVTFGANLKATVTSVKEVKEILSQCKTERDVERVLRDSDIFSKTDALHFISIIKTALRDSKGKEVIDNPPSEMVVGILEGLRDLNKDSDTTGILNSLRRINL